MKKEEIAKVNVTLNELQDRNFKWFAPVIGGTVLLFLLIFLVIMVAPRQDAKKRGFIPCTQKMVETMVDCPDTLCILQAVFVNTGCDLKVIGQGFVLFAKGEQKTPWANYIFEPEPEQLDNADMDEYYKAHPNLKEEMDELKRLNKELENEEK